MAVATNTARLQHTTSTSSVARNCPSTVSSVHTRDAGEQSAHSHVHTEPRWGDCQSIDSSFSLTVVNY